MTSARTFRSKDFTVKGGFGVRNVRNTVVSGARPFQSTTTSINATKYSFINYSCVFCSPGIFVTRAHSPCVVLWLQTRIIRQLLKQMFDWRTNRQTGHLYAYLLGLVHRQYQFTTVHDLKTSTDWKWVAVIDSCFPTIVTGRHAAEQNAVFRCQAPWKILLRSH